MELMPRIAHVPLIISVDCEATGLDLHHGAAPFLVTLCFDVEQSPIYWEWDVDPITRRVLYVKEDLLEIQEWLDKAGTLVFQNGKFDVSALTVAFKQMGLKLRFDWNKVADTILDGHLLASNQPHDLTTMALVYLGVNIKPFEEAIDKATIEARGIAEKQFPTWRLAKKGDPMMPSIEKKVYKADMWLPRTLAKALNYPKGECTVVNLRQEKFDLRIDRTTKWGNPFVIGKDGTREEVIDKYQDWIEDEVELLDSLHELDGKRLGCFCSPLPCHGHILQKLVAKLAHPWLTVCAEYANVDTPVTLALHFRQQELIRER